MLREMINVYGEEYGVCMWRETGGERELISARIGVMYVCRERGRERDD